MREKRLKLFNKLNPERIMIKNLHIHKDTPLYPEAKNNKFTKQTNALMSLYLKKRYIH